MSLPEAFDAIRQDKIQDVLRFLNQGKDVDLKGYDDKTLLYMAIYWDRHEIAEMLILRGADVNYIKDGYPPLYYAAFPDRTLTIKLLLKNKADPKLIDDPNLEPLRDLIESVNQQINETK